jgi:hypothetical protein
MRAAGTQASAAQMFDALDRAAAQPPVARLRLAVVAGR